MEENTFHYNKIGNQNKNLTICDVSESVHLYDDIGIELWWFGSDPPEGIPSPAYFLECINKHNLREFPPPWGAIVLDKNIHKIWIATDFLGLFHLFYRKINDSIIIGPNAISIASLNSVKLDSIGIYELIFRGNPQRGHTLFEDIKCLAPATLIEIDDNYNKRVYWKIPKYTPLKTKDAIRLFKDAVHSSVKRHWRKEDVQELTAGRDSMMLLSTYINLNIPVRTWTFGYQNSYDLVGANRRAKHFNLDHQVIYKEPLLQLSSQQIFDFAKEYLNASSGMANILEYWHLVPVLKMVNAKGTTTGVGGEVFRGFYYQWAGKGFLPKSIARVLLQHGKIMEMMPLPNYILKKEICKEVNNEIKNEIDEALNFTNDYWYNLDVYYLMHRMHHFAGTTFSATKSWLNVRMPLFDPVVVDCLPFIPTEIKKWSNGLSKIVTEENLKKYNNISDLKLSNEVFLDRIKRIKNRMFHEMRGTLFRDETTEIVRTILKDKDSKTLLNYSDMVTADIYDKNRFLNMIKNLENGSPIPLFIGSILTAEMAARETNAIL